MDRRHEPAPAAAAQDRPAALGQEGQALHIHQHLDIFVRGRKETVPANIGIDPSGGFISPLHTHDTTGVLHVESPTVESFSLGQFFAVVGRAAVRDAAGRAGHRRRDRAARVGDGQPVNANPTRIVLDSHQEIVLAYGTQAQMPEEGAVLLHVPRPGSSPAPCGRPIPAQAVELRPVDGRVHRLGVPAVVAGVVAAAREPDGEAHRLDGGDDQPAGGRGGAEVGDGDRREVASGADQRRAARRRGARSTAPRRRRRAGWRPREVQRARSWPMPGTSFPRDPGRWFSRRVWARTGVRAPFGREAVEPAQSIGCRARGRRRAASPESLPPPRSVLCATASTRRQIDDDARARSAACRDDADLERPRRPRRRVESRRP